MTAETPPTGMSPLTVGDWECMVCHTLRSYDKISVAMRPLMGAEASYPGTRVNVRFCNDNPDCEAVATEEGPWQSSPLPTEE